jgi:hypothetical protein
MSWRLARGLERLRQQVNAKYPNRGKAADGTIGDRAHAARASDHNPVRGVVHALDLTHSPGKGYDAHAHADRIRQSKDGRVKYIISNRRITSAKTGWSWAAYRGSNPHSGHVHYSIHLAPHADNTKEWRI